MTLSWSKQISEEMLNNSTSGRVDHVPVHIVQRMKHVIFSSRLGQRKHDIVLSIADRRLQELVLPSSDRKEDQK